MAVVILNLRQKQEAHRLVTKAGKSLTEVGNTFGVSRKTIRRVVDEINLQTEKVEGFEGIKVGDLVLIANTSKLYGTDVKTNPADTSGEVVGIKTTCQCVVPGFKIVVKWANGFYNVYREEDLVVFAREFVDAPLEEVEEQDNGSYFFSATQDSISMVRVVGEEVESRNINKTSSQFDELRAMLVADTSNKTLKEVFTLMDTRAVLEAFSVGRIKVDADSETVIFVKPDGSERAVPEDIAGDIIETVKSYGRDRSQHLVKFLDFLMNNTSFQAIEGLYSFMKHNCIEITQDGFVRAWKGVRSDLYDKHSGTIYNGDFGKEIRVDRSEVDDNPDNTCSYGLHVGAKEYASAWGDTLLEVTVNPADVVAVPKDYNGQKMRCAAYTPVRVVAK